MDLIFKYDIDRLTSYSQDAANKIKIEHENSCVMLSFPEVGYFNYAFPINNQPLTAHQVTHIKDFYISQQIIKHKVVVAAGCKNSNAALHKNAAYKQVATIAKTVYSPVSSITAPVINNLLFIKADHENIDHFTEIYLDGFEAAGSNRISASNNFKKLLTLKNLDLFLAKHHDNYVGVNVLYKTTDEVLLAGGATLPHYRNMGFHKNGLAFRIKQSSNAKSIVAWAYKDSISLKNMLKLKMQVQQEFNVYEYCK
jgi:hypothetical protein